MRWSGLINDDIISWNAIPWEIVSAASVIIDLPLPAFNSDLCELHEPLDRATITETRMFREHNLAQHWALQGGPGLGSQPKTHRIWTQSQLSGLAKGESQAYHLVLGEEGAEHWAPTDFRWFGHSLLGPLGSSLTGLLTLSSTSLPCALPKPLPSLNALWLHIPMSTSKHSFKLHL